MVELDGLSVRRDDAVRRPTNDRESERADAVSAVLDQVWSAVWPNCQNEAMLGDA